MAGVSTGTLSGREGRTVLAGRPVCTEAGRQLLPSVFGLGGCDVSVFGLRDRGMSRAGAESERQAGRLRGDGFLGPSGNFVGLLVIWGGGIRLGLIPSRKPTGFRERQGSSVVCLPTVGRDQALSVQREGPQFPTCGLWAAQPFGLLYRSCFLGQKSQTSWACKTWEGL